MEIILQQELNFVFRLTLKMVMGREYKSDSILFFFSSVQCSVSSMSLDFASITKRIDVPSMCRASFSKASAVIE